MTNNMSACDIKEMAAGGAQSKSIQTLIDLAKANKHDELAVAYKKYSCREKHLAPLIQVTHARELCLLFEALCRMDVWNNDLMELFVLDRLMPYQSYSDVIHMAMARNQLEFLYHCVLLKLDDLSTEIILKLLIDAIRRPNEDFSFNMDSRRASSAPRQSEITGNKKDRRKDKKGKKKNSKTCTAMDISVHPDENVDTNMAPGYDHGEATSTFSSNKCCYINTILAHEFTYEELVDTAKIMDFNLVVILLRHLVALLLVLSPERADTSVDIGSKWQGKRKQLRSRSSKRITLMKVVEWLQAVVDAHFTQLALSTDVYALIIELAEVVDARVQFQKELKAIGVLIKALRAKSKVKNKQYPGQYCIQRVEIF